MKPVRVPTVSWPAMIMFPPVQRMPTQAVYMASWKTGVLSTAPEKVLVAVAARSELTSEKRLATWSSRT